MNTISNERASSYAGALQPLLVLGEASLSDASAWPDYAADFDLHCAHVAELVRMATDEELSSAGSGSPLVWAPVHAWRSLGQLRADEAVAPLVALLKREDDDDFAISELPVVLGMIGRAAIPAIAAALAKRSKISWLPSCAADGLKEIAQRHPEVRAECVALLIKTLERGTDIQPFTAGSVVSALIDLAAVEAMDAIRAAFRQDAVDISIAGDEEDVEIALGLRASRTTPKPNYITLDAARNPWDTPGQSAPKVGRNDPCPCGSGKKYKKCCLA